MLTDLLDENNILKYNILSCNPGYIGLTQV